MKIYSYVNYQVMNQAKRFKLIKKQARICFLIHHIQ